MTRIEREQLIDRYVQGMMPTSEEERFLIEVASDPELRYELKASQVIDRAISKDKSRGVIPTGKMRANIALLAAPANSVPAEVRDAVTTPGGWFSGWTAGPGGVVALMIVGSLLISGDPAQNRYDLAAPADQVVSIEHEDLEPIVKVTEFDRPISVDMVSSEAKNQSVKNEAPHLVMNRTAASVSTHSSSSSQVQSNPTQVQQPAMTSVVPPTSESLADPGIPLSRLDTGVVNTLIDQGVDASDTTNSGEPSMKLLFDQGDALN